MPPALPLVRPARSGDADGIARVHVDAWRETYTGLVPERYFDDTAYRARVKMWTRYLLADEQGRGVGRMLLDAVLGGSPAQLWLLAANSTAQAFYERAGFRADGVEVTDDDLAGVAEIRMVR